MSRDVHADLVRRACAWLAGPRKKHAIVPELRTWVTCESPDVIAWRNESVRARAVSTLVECKASRADFLADANKPFRRRPETGMGAYRWYFCPPDLLRREDMPESWGLAWCMPRGVRVVVPALRIAEWNRDAESALLTAALRRVCFPNPKFPPVHWVFARPDENQAGAVRTSTEAAE